VNFGVGPPPRNPGALTKLDVFKRDLSLEDRRTVANELQKRSAKRSLSAGRAEEEPMDVKTPGARVTRQKGMLLGGGTL
jgi:hypothetical protein